MNKRIRELAEQARKYARDYVAECKHYGYYMEHNEEQVRFEGKFAELLLKECLHIVDDEGCGEGGSVRAIEKIKQHFGVEQ